MFLNHVVLIGRLTADPESRFTQSGVQVARFRLAVDRPFVNQQTGQRETDFIPIVVWGKQAEICADHLSKGRLIALTGRIQVRPYVEPTTGEKRTFTEVVANTVRFLEKRDNSSNGQPKGDLTGEAGDDFSSDGFPPVDDFSFGDDEPPF